MFMESCNRLDTPSQSRIVAYQETGLWPGRDGRFLAFRNSTCSFGNTYAYIHCSSPGIVKPSRKPDGDLSVKNPASTHSVLTTLLASKRSQTRLPKTRHTSWVGAVQKFSRKCELAVADKPR